MDNQHRNRRVAILARASRFAGHHGQFRARTHYLSPNQLRTVPVTRLLRETAWAHRPDASERWRDERRGIVGDEFDRRGFHDAAQDVRLPWQETDRDGRAIVEQQRHEAELRELEAERNRIEARERDADRTQDAALLWAVTTLVAADTAVEVVSGDELMEDVTAQLDHVWEQDEADPAMGGDLDTSVGADLADSLAADAEPATETAVEVQAPAATPDVYAEAEL